MNKTLIKIGSVALGASTAVGTVLIIKKHKSDNELDREIKRTEKIIKDNEKVINDMEARADQFMAEMRETINLQELNDEMERRIKFHEEKLKQLKGEAQ